MSATGWLALVLTLSGPQGAARIRIWRSLKATGAAAVRDGVYVLPATDAFETANYSITPIPEPQTYALLLAGLGAVGFVARRRNK